MLQINMHKRRDFPWHIRCIVSWFLVFSGRTKAIPKQCSNVVAGYSWLIFLFYSGLRQVLHRAFAYRFSAHEFVLLPRSNAGLVDSPGDKYLANSRYFTRSPQGVLIIGSHF
jgi:hypothetical protein